MKTDAANVIQRQDETQSYYSQTVTTSKTNKNRYTVRAVTKTAD